MPARACPPPSRNVNGAGQYFHMISKCPVQTLQRRRHGNGRVASQQEGLLDVRQDAMISIIDDDDSVREATASLVRSLGLTTSTFASAEEFLHSPRPSDRNCVITDVQIPSMSGLELQDRLLLDGHRLPLIFMTAFPEERLRRRAMAAGAIGFLSKPFDGNEMIDCIDEALGGAA